MDKKCFKCGITKPLIQFYKNKRMADGHVNKCKICNLKDVAIHRENNIEKIRKYDRARGSRQTPEYLREWRAKYPNKYKAHYMVKNAIKSGNLHKEPCSECGEIGKTHAHHNDYLKPLNVRWLCPAHHSQWHAKHGEALNP